MNNYYVYELISPLDNKVFYVGKGKNKRAFDHVKEAFRNQVNNLRKFAVIKNILSFGLLPITNIVEYFDDEQEALDFEERLIAQYGIENLTNILVRGVLRTNPIDESEAIAKSIIMKANYDLQTSKREAVINNAHKDIEAANKILGLVDRLRHESKANIKARKLLP